MRPLRLTIIGAGPVSLLLSLAAFGVALSEIDIAAYSLLFLLLLDTFVGANTAADGDDDDVKILFACCRAAFFAIASIFARLANVSSDGGRPRLRPFDDCCIAIFGLLSMLVKSVDFVGGRPGLRLMGLSVQPILLFGKRGTTLDMDELIVSLVLCSLLIIIC